MDLTDLISGLVSHGSPPEAPGSWSRDLDLESIPFMEAHRPFERGLWALSQPSMLEPGAFFALFSLLSHEASLGVSHVRV